MVIPVDSVTRAKAQLSVEMNNLLVPLNRVAENLVRFCRPLAFFNQGTALDLSFSGSSLLLRHQGRNFLLCCRHQLTNARRRPDEIVIILDGDGSNKVGLMPDEVAQTILDPASEPALADLADVLIAEYRPKPGGRDIARHFYPLDLDATPDLRGVAEGTADPIFAIGYPASDASYEPSYDQNWQTVGADVVSRWVKLYLKPAEPTVWDQPGLLPLEPASENVHVQEKLDGVSGAPVFFIHDAHIHAPKLGFAGMVVRGSRVGRINILEAAQIRRIFTQLLD